MKLPLRLAGVALRQARARTRPLGKSMSRMICAGSNPKTLAICLINVVIKSRIPNDNKQIPVEVATDRVDQYLESNWPGLNEMTEWLQMPIEENKRIIFDVMRSLGFE
ncbi:hypothetical protein [Acidiferrobacter sp.]